MNNFLSRTPNVPPVSGCRNWRRRKFDRTRVPRAEKNTAIGRAKPRAGPGGEPEAVSLCEGSSRMLGGSKRAYSQAGEKGAIPFNGFRLLRSEWSVCTRSDNRAKLVLALLHNLPRQSSSSVINCRPVSFLEYRQPSIDEPPRRRGAFFCARGFRFGEQRSFVCHQSRGKNCTGFRVLGATFASRATRVKGKSEQIGNIPFYFASISDASKREQRDGFSRSRVRNKTGKRRDVEDGLLRQLFANNELLSPALGTFTFVSLILLFCRCLGDRPKDNRFLSVCNLRRHPSFTLFSRTPR